MRPSLAPARTIFLCALLAILPFTQSLFASLPFQWATVGDAGNTANFTPSGTFGEVSTIYRIGATEVTNQQYVEFLNAADPNGTNALGLFNGNMEAKATGGISNHGGGPRYFVKTGHGNNPVNFVSWIDAIRYINWVHNGQGSMGAAITETGAYTLLGGTPVPSNFFSVARNPGARAFLPTENEWYKAAYYKGAGLNSGYWNYPTKSDSQPYSVNAPGLNTPNQSNTANFFKDDGSILTSYNSGYAVTGRTTGDSNQNYLTDVGAYNLSVGPYGTFDQGGNVREWTETYDDLSTRVMRGGDFANDATRLFHQTRFVTTFSNEGESDGFRFAATTAPPEWNADASGSWSTGSNWTSPGVPGGIATGAQFLGKITAPRSVSLDSDVTLGTLLFANPNTYSIIDIPGWTLTLGDPTSGGNLTVQEGRHQIIGRLKLLGVVNINIAAGSAFTIAGPLTTAAGTVINKFGEGSLDINDSQNHPSPALLVISGGTVNMGTNPGFDLSVKITGSRLNLNTNVELGELTIDFAADGTQTLDLNSSPTGFHTLRVYAANLDATKTALIAAIRNANAPGALNPLDGIIDSGLHPGSAIGIIKEVGRLLIRPTAIGDSNLDGVVSIADFITLASHFNQPGTWEDGDMNGDGMITIADFIDLASHFGQSYSGEAFPISASDYAQLSAFATANGQTVPEPGIPALTTIATTILFRRRARK
jgi:formylglycine-generating enzyme required for sulfatase activity